MSIMKIAVVLLCVSAPLQAQEWIMEDRVDVRPDGTASTAPYGLGEASISDDGRWVIFESAKSDLVAGDTNGATDVFIRDRTTQTTRRISVLADGSQASVGGGQPHASRDGRFVSFYSGAALVADDTNGKADIYLLDRDTNGNGIFDEPGFTTLRRVSVDPSGGQSAYNVVGARSAVSDDGSSVAFATLAPLVATDNNNKSDVYVRDLAADNTLIMSISDAGTVGNVESPDFFGNPLRISDNGRYVAFSSAATNLVPGDSNGYSDVFVRDRDSDDNGIFDEPGNTTIRRASLEPGGGQVSSNVRQFDLDPSGQWLAFSYFTSGGNNPNGADIYLSEQSTGSVTRIDFDASTWANSGATCCGNQYPLLSEDAGVVVFKSHQNYPKAGGGTITNADVFAWTPDNGLTNITHFPPPGSGGSSVAAGPIALSANGKYLVIQTVSGSTHSTYVYRQKDAVDPAALFKDGFETAD